MPAPIPGWSPSTPAVQPAEIDALWLEHPAIAIHFWASWNGHDPTMDSALQAVAAQFASRVQFFSANVDLEENLPLCKHCRIANVPTLAILVPGRPPQLIVGVCEPEQMAAKIEARLQPQEPQQPPRRSWWQIFARKH